MSSDLLNSLIEQAQALSERERHVLVSRLLEDLHSDNKNLSAETLEQRRRRLNPNFWIKEHFDEYEGQWVALDGNRLLAHGSSPREVLEEAVKCGVPNPFLGKVDAKQGTRMHDTPDEARYRRREFQWLKEHRHEYPGEHLALEGDQLIAHSKTLREVIKEAREAGAKEPLFVYVESPDEPPFGGW